jgi:hypothetical protein
MRKVFGVEFQRSRLLALIVASHAIFIQHGLSLLLSHCLLQAGSGKFGIAGDAGECQSAGSDDPDPRGLTHLRYCAWPISF